MLFRLSYLIHLIWRWQPKRLVRVVLRYGSKAGVIHRLTKLSLLWLWLLRLLYLHASLLGLYVQGLLTLVQSLLLHSRLLPLAKEIAQGSECCQTGT